MGQGHRSAAVSRSAGSAGAQAISRRIHRADHDRLSAAAGRQGAAEVSAAVHCCGEIIRLALDLGKRQAIMQRVTLVRRLHRISLAVSIVVLMALSVPAHAAPDAAFTQFIASLWPEAQAQGVSRVTFDNETRGLEPDYKLPDLILPGRPATGAPRE